MTTLEKTLCVLVVDDDADHATSLATLLGEYGYDSHVCLHAQDCMEAVERLPGPQEASAPSEEAELPAHVLLAAYAKRLH